MSGRPSEYRSRVVYTFSCEAELLERFKEVARREGRPVSRLLQELMEDYLKKHGRGNPAFPLDKWVENKDFIAFPTLGEKPDPELAKKMPDEMVQTIRYYSWEWYQLMTQEENRRRYERGVR